MNVIQRLGRRIGHTTAFGKIGPHVFPPIDRAVNRLSGGRVTLVNLVLSTFVLVHRGAKTGKEYRTPLSYITIGDAFALAASNFGRRNHPAWSYNLLADPDAAVVVRGETIPVRARRVPEDEKAELWPRFLDVWPPYGTYEKRASHRNIKVFVLDRR